MSLPFICNEDVALIVGAVSVPVKVGLEVIPMVKLPELSVAIVIGVVGVIPLTVVPPKIAYPPDGPLAVSAFCLLLKMDDDELNPTLMVVPSEFAVMVIGSAARRF